MARHEREFSVAADGPLTLAELLALPGATTDDAERARQDAIACYLSASEGWAEAVQRLGGTFAGKGRELRDGKID